MLRLLICLHSHLCCSSDVVTILTNASCYVFSILDKKRIYRRLSFPEYVVMDCLVIDSHHRIRHICT